MSKKLTVSGKTKWATVSVKGVFFGKWGSMSVSSTKAGEIKTISGMVNDRYVHFAEKEE